MNRPSFDVLNQPWIPVVRLDGSCEELGILPCLEQAHELREIRDPSPIIEFGLYRLLVAFVLDALVLADRRPEHPLDLKRLIDEKRFDMKLLNDYADQCGNVFDLFHPMRPFLQVRMDRATAKPLAGLFPAVPSGTNASHWHHEHEDTMAVSSGEAARLLTTLSPFMTAGGAGLSPSINGAPAIYALPIGDSLFETLIISIPLRSDQEGGCGTTAWRSTRIPGDERTSATSVEALTWRPRRVQFLPDLPVRQMRFERGDSTRFTWIDASLAYRYEKDKVTPVRMRENRPLWRDAGPLALLREDPGSKTKENKVAYKRPDVLQQAFELMGDGKSLVIQAYGLRTDMKMKVFEWAKSSWSVPSKLGRSTRLGSLVHHELERAERAASALRACIKALFPRDGAANKEALKTTADRCERAYWQHLELRFHPLMNAFAQLDPDAPDDPDLIAATAKDWREAVKSLAVEHFESAAEDMDTDSDALERQVRARTRLHNILKGVLS